MILLSSRLTVHGMMQLQIWNIAVMAQENSAKNSSRSFHEHLVVNPAGITLGLLYSNELDGQGILTAASKSVQKRLKKKKLQAQFSWLQLCLILQCNDLMVYKLNRSNCSLTQKKKNIIYHYSINKCAFTSFFWVYFNVMCLSLDERSKRQKRVRILNQIKLDFVCLPKNKQLMKHTWNVNIITLVSSQI